MAALVARKNCAALRTDDDRRREKEITALQQSEDRIFRHRAFEDFVIQWLNLNQAVQSLWIKQSDNEVRGRQYNAAIAGLIGIAPQDEIEGMIAAQLIAAHNATMECYRRAMIGEQTLEGRRDNLSQANKLSRTYATLIEALNRHRGKGGRQKVTVEHV